MERIISVQKKNQKIILYNFFLCLCKNDRSEIKRLLKHQKNRSYCERMEPLKKKISLDMQAKLAKAKKERDKYRTMDHIKKQELLNKKAEKCRAMDSDKKQQLLNKNEEKYRTMDSHKKQQLSNKNAEKYRTMDNDQKKDLIDKQDKNYYSNKSKDIYSCIDQFKKKIRQGPYFICCVCNRSL